MVLLRLHMMSSSPKSSEREWDHWKKREINQKRSWGLENFFILSFHPHTLALFFPLLLESSFPLNLYYIRQGRRHDKFLTISSPTWPLQLQLMERVKHKESSSHLLLLKYKTVLVIRGYKSTRQRMPFPWIYLLSCCPIICLLLSQRYCEGLGL